MELKCLLSGLKCRHCSDEVERTVTRTGDSVKGIHRTESAKSLGQFCNNDGRTYVKDLAVCPATIKPSEPFTPWNEVSELEWMRIKGSG